MRWKLFSEHFRRDLLLLSFLFFYLMLFRIVLIVSFSSKISDSADLFDYYSVFLHGSRFDISVAAYFVLISVFSTIIFSILKFKRIQNIIRYIFAIIYIIICSFIFVVSIEYFREYDNQFNHFLFMILYDDQKAVFQTAIEEYHLILCSLIILFLIASLLFLYWKWSNLSFTIHIEKVEKPIYQVIVSILILACFIGALRGSFRKRPVMRKWAGISTDIFLNKTVMNPFIQLKYAIQDFKRINNLNSTKNPFLKRNENIRDVAQFFFESDSNYKHLSAYLKKKTKGRFYDEYDHVFLIVMESLDSWPFKKSYADLHLVDRLKDISKKGVFFPRTLSAARSTMNSFASLITGVPYVGINISRIVNKPFNTSLTPILKKLSYRSRFFYGGFLTWQNIGTFMEKQGFEDIYASPSMENLNSDGIWGVQDETLFNFVLKKVGDYKKSFNVILTTSYHPPYNIAIYKKGFLLKEIPDAMKDKVDDTMSIIEMGHLWYSVDRLVSFIREIEKILPKSIFFITGDHYGRRFLNSVPSEEEKSYVPFIIYGKNVQANFSDSLVHSHHDIFPSILEYIAPKGTDYFSFGESAFMYNSHSYKISFSRIASDEELFLKTNLGKNGISIKEKKLKEKIKQQHSLSWQYLFRGDKLF